MDAEDVVLLCFTRRLLSIDAAERPESSSSLLPSGGEGVFWLKDSLGVVGSWAMWPARNDHVVMMFSSLGVRRRLADPLRLSSFSILP